MSYVLRAVFGLNCGVNCKKLCLCCYVPRKKLTDITMKYKEHDSEDSKEIFEQAISCRTKKESDDCLKKKGLRLVEARTSKL